MFETIINTWYAPLIAMVVIWIFGFFFLRYLIREHDKAYNNYKKQNYERNRSKETRHDLHGGGKDAHSI